MSTTAEQATDTLIASSRAGNATIDLRQHHASHYSVTTTIGTERSSEWSGTFPTLDRAADEASRVWNLFETFGSDTAIATHAETLRREHTELIYRARRRMAPAGSIEAVRVELDSLETLAERAVIAGLRSQIAA